MRRGLSAHFRLGVLPHLANGVQSDERGLSPSHPLTSCCLCLPLLGDTVLHHKEVLGGMPPSVLAVPQLSDKPLASPASQPPHSSDTHTSGLQF